MNESDILNHPNFKQLKTKRILVNTFAVTL